MRQAGLVEHRTQVLTEARAVTALEHGARDALRRVLGMQVERPPLDPRAEPALEPRRPLEGDVAERSYVIAPDDDRRHAVDSVDHQG
jgi:hypothetical protein